MHINMKYYIVTIGAIFIALGIGMLVGFNLNYDQELSKQQAAIIDDLDAKFEDIKTTNDELEGKLDKKESEYKKLVNYLNQNYLVLIKDQLQGKNVGIISTTENYDYTQDIAKTITDANGSVAYDIVLKSGLTNKDKIKELDSALQLQLKTEKDVVNYIMSCLKEENAMDKLQQLEKLEMIKINYLSDNYLDCSQVVMASGDTNESSHKFTNIDKIIIDKLKEDGKYVIGTQKSDVKFSDLENYKKDKIPTINNSQQGTGKLSLVYALRDSVEKGNFGIGDKVDSIIPFK
ncbi:MULTISPECIES: copper transporter [Paraclostridium]|uniref:Copper transporter n=1 Tax=Paraclostridium bifermentans TaxID=1490 RepID=A0AA44DHU1_PARBF|nr:MULTISPECIES: copper transporter [Paraclostridium]MBN8048363.1 copper transporter [Paraclostridium bifermentans]MBZ6005954.1 copper transporter [Paraclostridium bifermentans]MDU0296089.1 copper transporter [Paraclostridium sp. MRS3W1]NME08043.1 copper transporter [Paraclostridium bifermentans]